LLLIISIISTKLRMRDYAIKCSDENQVKLQVGRPDLYRKIIQALWINNDGYYMLRRVSRYLRRPSWSGRRGPHIVTLTCNKPKETP
jgi:hypothetical protein